MLFAFVIAISLAAPATALHPHLSPSRPAAETQPTASPPTVALGLSAPIEKLRDLEAFEHRLARRLVWTLETDDGSPEPLELRFTAVRIERGRVTASFQSDPIVPRPEPTRIADTLGRDRFLAFPDVCFSADDPPATVRALAGSGRLDAEGLELAVAELARTGRLGDRFGLDDPPDLEWGRDVVVILSAAAVDADSPALVRPLILVVRRV
ncbi:MAG: hypothetical protein ACODAA_00025 [Gemmatimonadota bacterium]